MPNGVVLITNGIKAGFAEAIIEVIICNRWE